MSRAALAVAAVVCLGLAACSSDSAASSTTVEPDVIEAIDADAQDDQSTILQDENDVQPSVTQSELGVLPDGFSTAIVEITKADGEVCEVCLWLADSSAERGQGLMGVTSLGTPDGMAFVYNEPTAGNFFMFQTVTPLSIAWFDTGGALVSTADMEPCLAERSGECPRFPSGGEYVLAIEVFQGELASIGITDGATARLLSGTEAADCPLA